MFGRRRAGSGAVRTPRLTGCQLKAMPKRAQPAPKSKSRAAKAKTKPSKDEAPLSFDTVPTAESFEKLFGKPELSTFAPQPFFWDDVFVPRCRLDFVGLDAGTPSVLELGVPKEDVDQDTQDTVQMIQAQCTVRR